MHTDVGNSYTVRVPLTYLAFDIPPLFVSGLTKQYLCTPPLPEGKSIGIRGGNIYLIDPLPISKENRV